MKYKILQLSLMAGCLTAVSASASLNLVVNGDFSAGNTGFTSSYTSGTGVQNSLLNAGANQGAGYYAVGTDPSFYNPNWTDGPTSVPGDPNAQMLIVNGSPNAGATVWQGSLSPGMVAGQTYTFSALVASLYPVSEPTLSFSIGGNTLGPITLTGAGSWETFTETFVAGSSSAGFIDLNGDLNGNDFAITEISITPVVPEPSTIVAGGLLLLPFGASTLRIMRKKIGA